MTFSEATIKEMGFRPFAEGEEIAVAFSSVTIFEARGVTLAPETTIISSGISAGVEYRLAACSSVNSGCYALLNDTFVEDEEEWKREKNVKVHLSWFKSDRYLSRDAVVAS